MKRTKGQGTRHLAVTAAVGVAAVAAVAGAAGGTRISGAGATFPYPLYAKWAAAYAAKTGVELNYQSIGSGGGIKQISQGTVDFGASDAPLKAEELDQMSLVQFPTVMGGVVPVVNVQGVPSGKLKLDGGTLADIYLGKIKKWNDERLRYLNQGVNLPDKAIAVVHRSDGSGTTWIFTNYLAKVSSDWAQKVGNDKSVSWPTGVGGKGNEGVASYVGRIDGAIGYVEYAYALQNKIPFALLRNKEGQFIEPTKESFQQAAARADWAKSKGFYVVLTDQPGPKTWPITGATFVLMRRQQQNVDTARAVLSFFAWAYHQGDDMADQLHYVPMPDDVVALVEKTWAQQIKGPNGEAVWKPTSGATEAPRQGRHEPAAHAH